MAQRQPKPHFERFGGVVRTFRRRSPYTAAALSRALNMSNGWVSQLERGLFGCYYSEARSLDTLLEAEGKILRAWDRFVAEDGDPFAEYLEHEPRAVSVATYASTYIPGLLQTPAYAGVLQGSSPKTLKRRLDRQRVLDRAKPPTLNVLLHESVLYEAVGDKDVMREVLEHILTMSERENITIQIVRFSAGTRPPSSSFALATLGDRSQIAWADTITGGSTIQDAGTLTYLAQTCARLQAQALNAEDTRALIRKVIEELWT